MFDLIIMLSRYLFVIYIGLYLWEAIVYIAYEQGGYLGSPYRAVSVQRRLVVLMHLTAFLILSYNRDTYLFDWQALLFGAISLVFLLVAIQLLDRFYYEGCPLIWTGMLFLMDVSLIMLQRVDPALAHKQLVWMALGLAGMLALPSILRLIPRFEIFEWAYIIVCYRTAAVHTDFRCGTWRFSQNWLGNWQHQLPAFRYLPSSLFIFYLASVFRKRVELRELLIHWQFECRRRYFLLVLPERPGQRPDLLYDLYDYAVHRYI